MTADTSPEQYVHAARKRYDVKDYAAAAGQFRLAADAYRAAGNLLSAVEMDNNRSVSLAMAGEYQGAWEAARETDQIFLQTGDIRRAGLACGNQAAALEGLGKRKEAAELYLRSAELLKQAGDAPARAAVLKTLTALQARQGDSLQALASAQAALNTGVKLSTREKFLKKLIDIPFQLLGRH